MRYGIGAVLAAAALCAVFAVALSASRSASAITPTPTYTGTPTATPTPGLPPSLIDLVATNSGPSAKALDVLTTAIGGHIPHATLTTNAPGCAAPTISEERVVVGQFGPFGVPPSSLPIHRIRTELRWPSECVDPGESVELEFHAVYTGLVHYVYFDPDTATLTPTYTPTNTPTITPTPTPTLIRRLAVDCDVSTAGIQDNCLFPTHSSTIAADIVFVNGPAPTTLGNFFIEVVNHDKSKLVPPSLGDGNLNGNPDFSDALEGGSWTCDLGGSPAADVGTGGPNQTVSFIHCLAFQALPVDAGEHLVLARVRYDVQAGAGPGVIPLTLRNVQINNDQFDTIGECAPVFDVPMPCLDATINLVDPPTPTATPTSALGVIKVPDGVGSNVDLSVPKANLWICEVGACAGPGEGALRVVERALSVQTGDQDGDTVEDGLGAYEFDVEYSPMAFASINPCDIVFGVGGAGSARGPVDELNSSAINPDCADDSGPAGNGSCAFSLIFENVVHFGCATSGQTPGPTGDFDLASLLLVPHEDLAADLFPGNDNGVVTVVKDKGCELVDIFGHPAVGSVGGGLTPVCGNLWVTIRILEGDIDLDCDVDVADQQKIALRYGSFFGSTLYSTWYDLEPNLHDLDIDIKDLQKVFGRDGSTCQAPVPEQTPVDPPLP